MASKKLLFVDDSSVSQWVVDNLRGRGHDVEITGSITKESDLGDVGLLVMDPAMPPTQLDLPVSAVDQGAIGTLRLVKDQKFRSVMFSSFGRSSLDGVLQRAGVQVTTDDLFDKREPDRLIEYLDEYVGK